MSGFDESERKGLIGKIINYFDSGDSHLAPENGWDYTAKEKKQILEEYFKIKELKQIYNKINECLPKTIFEKINPLFSDNKIEKVYNYLALWKSSYWNGEDMSGFLCGTLGKMRVRIKKAQIEAISKISNKTNDNVSNLVKEYSGLGGKIYKISRKSKTRKSKTRKSRKLE